MAARKECLRVEGRVLEALPNAAFKVEIEGGHLVEAYTSGRMRMHNIRIVPGDVVQVELSPYDLKRGRIVYRGRTEERRGEEEEAVP